MSIRKRLLPLVLTVAVLFGVASVPAFAAQTGATDTPAFSDMPDDWSTAALQNAVANGLLEGANGKIMPNDPLTRAQMAAVITRAFGAEVQGNISAFSDVRAGDWYAESIAKAYQMGVLKGSDGRMNPQNAITRQEVFAILARAFKLQPAGSMAKEFPDADQISDWARSEVYALVNAGYIQGDDGRLNPTGLITRAQFAQVFDNIVKQYIRTAGEYTQVAAGNVMINVPGVTLKNLTVSGDLIIGDGVGDGDVVLDNVKVTGRMVVRGGGENSVIIRGSSSVGSVIVSRVDGAVSIKVQGGAEVEVVYVDDGSDDVIVQGTVGSVEIQAPGVTVNAAGATIGSVDIAAANVNLIVGEGSRVGSVDVFPGATGSDIQVSGRVDTVTTNAPDTTVTGSGTVTQVKALAGADNSKIETPKTQITVGDGVNGVTGGGGTALEGGSTVNNNDSGTGVTTTPPSGSGGGGSAPKAPVNVSTLPELEAALANTGIATIVFTANITAEEEEPVSITRAVTITGDFTFNGTFLVKSDGVTIDGLTISNEGDLAGESTWKRAAIYAYCKRITIKNCTFEMNPAATGICNGIVILPSAANVNYTITGNTVIGYKNVDGGYSSAGLTISGGIFKDFLDMGGDSVLANLSDAQDLAIITGNTFTDCLNDYQRETWAGGQQISCKSVSNGDNLLLGYAADSAKYYITGDVTRDSNATVKAGTELIVTEDGTLTVAAGTTLTVNGTLTVYGTLTVNGTLDNYYGTIGSESNYVQCFLGEDATVMGGTIYGSLLVTGDGVTIDDVTVYNKGDAAGESTWNRAAIYAYCKDITITNSLLEMNADTDGICNGIVILPSAASVNYTITENTVTGYEKLDGGYSSAGLTISGGIIKSFLGMDTESVLANLTDEEDLALIEDNDFYDCLNDYQRETWAGGQKISCKSISNGDNLLLGYADTSAKYYITGDVTRDSDATVKAGTELIVTEDGTLTVAAGTTLTVNGTLTASEGPLVGTNETSVLIIGESGGFGAYAAGTYEWDGDSWELAD